jgi:tetratricopeptide (TPR) repeat protein
MKFQAVQRVDNGGAHGHLIRGVAGRVRAGHIPRLFTHLAARFRGYNVKAGLKRWFVTRLMKLGHAFYKKNHVIRSMSAFKTVLDLDPNNEQALWDLLGIYFELGAVHMQVELLETWIQNNNNHIFAYYIMYEMYITYIGEEESAAPYLREASLRAPGHPVVILMEGLLRRYKNDLAGSNACFRSALEKAPDCNPIRMSLASNLKDQNRMGEAIGLLEEAIHIDPDDASPYFELAMSKYYKDINHNHIQVMRRLANTRAPSNGWLSIHFALGNVLDSFGLYDEAFYYFRSANDYLKQFFQMDQDDLRRSIDEQIGLFHRDFLKERSQSLGRRRGENLAFIVGMPRSGSTLVEQILASHPGVEACGERPDIPVLIESLPARLDTQDPYPACVRLLDPDAADRISKDYLENVAGPEPSGRLLTNKMLMNDNNLGLISLLFPGAKIIHCRRNPIDLCLSCYFTHFPHLPYTRDLNNIALVYCEHERIMAHWRASLPVHIFEVEYEKMVADPEPLIRSMLDHCGLPWDPVCLNFHQTQRPVQTASRFQVKSPIYSSSAGRWKNYEKHIPELVMRFQMVLDSGEA